ncbi:MAG: hypothetical protein Q4E54_08270 [Lachnospiraceae bacterium]|nr:hypothetical protein [Lachnospiraceae bacterium]
MGAGQSDLYKGTYGDREENILEDAKRPKNEREEKEVRLPDNESQTKHIFGKRDGHVPDTPENRKMLEDLANNKELYRGRDADGCDWNSEMQQDGSQKWVRYRNGRIINGGINNPPRRWDSITGYNYNPF